ncbi:hypothetical protein OsI_37493 [Oryza sativa Indica Group]|uniref:Expressed protein n=3 Tax=Oryza sativa TaxID=4530 RepID=Q2QXK4_ORYSJ|nr:expressed protein [Oryza sativa Japonica Group]EEC68872.1 hypothetical protein OsI_37493 [Oryza sativa Indica Group]EEE52785.1 hypothetical protein OsJ_35256 [Oryza sativa Japonica Group]
MDVKGRSASAPASPCVVLGDDAADAAAVAKVDRKYGSMLNAGSPLQILYTDQLADAKGGLKANAPCEITSVTECTCPLELQGMLKEECVDQYKLLSDRLLAKIVPKVARVKKPVSSSEVYAEFGVSAYSKYGTRTVSTSLRVCRQEKTSSSGMSNPVQKDHPVRNAHGTGNEVFKIPWIFGSVAFCVILLIFLWYLWWSKAASNACQLQSLPLNRNWRLSSDGGPWAERRRSSGRRSSAQLKERRMSYS